ncbi:MAG: hypothetical protein U5R49_24550 [Deltaproteobacteria bacterium]|nr:hypothetical protein [Deltaproteobacteria bacterium]
MALRLIQVFLPAERREEFHRLISKHSVQETWEERLAEGRLLIQTLASANTTAVGILVGSQAGKT